MKEGKKSKDTSLEKNAQAAIKSITYEAESYSMTWIAPVGHWHSHALQTRHSSTLAAEDFPLLTS